MELEKAKAVSGLYNRRTYVEMLARDCDSVYRSSGDRDAETTVRIPVRWLPVVIAKAYEEMADIERMIGSL